HGFTSETRGASRMNWKNVCTPSQVSEAQPFGTRIDGLQVAVFEHEGRYYAIEDRCPHADTRLSNGFVEGCEIECPLHEARFDIRDGRCTHGRELTGRDVRSYPLRIVDGHLQIDIEHEEMSA